MTSTYASHREACIDSFGHRTGECSASNAMAGISRGTPIHEKRVEFVRLSEIAGQLGLVTNYCAVKA
jgi:hypothetical protein